MRGALTYKVLCDATAGKGAGFGNAHQPTVLLGVLILLDIA